MARTVFDDEEEDKPLDPAVEKVRRKLLRFVFVNLGILFVALIAVVAALIYKTWTERPQTPPLLAGEVPGAAAEGTIALPTGARIVSQSLWGERLSLQVELPGGGQEIIVYDMVRAAVVGRYRVADQ